MGGPLDDSAGASVGHLATIHVRCSNGNKFVVEAPLASTVGAFKDLLVEKCEIPIDQQRLIFKGRVLKDDNSLESYGLQNDLTVHLVRGAPSLISVSSPFNTSATTSPASAGQFPPADNTGFDGGANLDGVPHVGAGDNSGLSLGMDMTEFQRMQQLMQNPNLMREMMSMPAFQSLLNNPELMRILIMSNPQMRNIIDRNPDLAHILNDPGTLRQTLDAARNPELMREMMRNTDRAMSNIEASPEGFNMLRRMYETVQEPLLNAATMGNDVSGERSSNPFGGLMGISGLNLNQGQPANLNGSASRPRSQANDVTATTAPNTAPLPNPWNPLRGGNIATQGFAEASSANAELPGLGDFGRLAGSAFGDLGGLSGGVLGLDPASMQQVMQNPTIQQMMQGLLSNPQYVNQVLNMQPQVRVMLNSNPQIREMIQSPDFLRQITNPESFQLLFQLQQTVLGQNQGRPRAEQVQGQTGAAGTIASLDLSSLQGMFGGYGSVPAMDASGGNAQPAEVVYASQLSLLEDMGFSNTQENVRALSATGGDVLAAVDWLLGNPS